VRCDDGQAVSENVFQALRLAGKIGFLSRGLWYDYFARGDERWRRRQLRYLVDRKLLTPHSNPAGQDYFILTQKCRRMLENENLVGVNPSALSQIYHDESVARWLLSLEKDGLVNEWQTESELKCQQTKIYQLSRDLRNQKYPDAVFKVSALGKERSFALEYERTQKSALRYKDILWLYSRSSSVGLVIFICENMFIQNAIEGRLRYLGIAELWDRVALTQAKMWRENPSLAPLQLGNKTIRLAEICERRKPEEVALSLARRGPMGV